MTPFKFIYQLELKKHVGTQKINVITIASLCNKCHATRRGFWALESCTQTSRLVMIVSFQHALVYLIRCV